MVLTPEELNYKLPVVKEGSKHFFSINCVKNWGFEDYYENTHNDTNKAKNSKTIELDYNNDLNWITRLSEVPENIKKHVHNLLSLKKAAGPVLRSNIAKRAAKRQKGQTIIINNNNNNGVVNNNLYNAGTSSPQLVNSEEAEEVAGAKRKLQSEPEEEAVNHEPSIWTKWLKYLNDHSSVFHPYSPEANMIIRSGRGISPKPYLDPDLYDTFLNESKEESFDIPQNCRQYIDRYVDSKNIEEAKKALRSLSAHLGTIEDDDQQLEFLEKILIEAQRSYCLDLDCRASEDAFNQYFVYPIMTSIAESIGTCGAYFEQGQPVLESMNRQLKASGLSVDDKSQYKTDGEIKLSAMKELELVLVETSGCFENKDKVKLNFDHHKGMFGTIAMLKCIADDYSYASIALFADVKVFFLNAAGTQLHLWSLSYHEEGVFDLCRVAFLDIYPEFVDKDSYIPELVKFCINAKNEIKKSIHHINVLKNDHDKTKAKYRYSSAPPPRLTDVLNPIILKLTKEQDSTGMADLGPIYTPRI